MEQTAVNPAVSSRALTGVILMCIAMFVVPLVDVAAKMLGDQGISAFQIVFLRMLMGTLFLLPIVLRYEPKAIPRIARNPGPILLLGFSIVTASICFFLSLRYMAIADAVAITFVQPFFVTILSKFVLKERVPGARWLALVIGFSATLMIIRPGTSSFEPASILPLMAGAFSAVYAITVRRGISGASGLATTFYTHAISLAMISPLMLFFWSPPTTEQWLLTVGMAAIGIIVQFMIVKAYEFGEASLIAPLSYTEMVSSVLAGWWFFRQLPDAITILGVCILIGCAFFTSYQTKKS